MLGSMPKLRIVYFSSRGPDLTNTLAAGLQQSGAEIILLVMTSRTTRQAHRSLQRGGSQ